MTKWEYKIHTINPTWRVSEKTLNEFGDEGWELISVVPLDNGQTQHIFKRKA